jgi:hypothetical protein
MSDEARSTSDESTDDNTPDPENELTGDGPDVDPLETGIAPPDRWSEGQRYGTTPAEQEEGEGLERRLAREVPDTTAGAVDDRWSGGPAPRSGRLVAPDEGAHPDTESQAVAEDVGIDGGAAGAEEAAVHVIPDEGDLGLLSDEELSDEPLSDRIPDEEIDADSAPEFGDDQRP